jgi:hypothetical protein
MNKKNTKKKGGNLPNIFSLSIFSRLNLYKKDIKNFEYIHYMARKNAKKRNYKKKRSKYSSSNYSPVQRMGKTIATFPGAGFPDRLNIKMRYNENLVIAAANNDFVYSGNGIYDPRVAVSGGQPLYFDQLSQLYSQYYVKAARITCTFLNTGVEPFGYAILPSTIVTATTYFNALEERDGIPNQAIHPNTSVTKKMSLFVKTKDIVEFVDKSDYQSAVSTVPVDQWYFHVLAQNLTTIPSSNLGAINIQIEYWVSFYNKFRVPPS